MKKPETPQKMNRHMYKDLGQLHAHNQHERIKTYKFST